MPTNRNILKHLLQAFCALLGLLAAGVLLSSLPAGAGLDPAGGAERLLLFVTDCMAALLGGVLAGVLAWFCLWHGLRPAWLRLVAALGGALPWHRAAEE